MFSISTFNFDIDGARVFSGRKNSFYIEGVSRRVRQTKLLSGEMGAYITDSGVFDVDRAITLTITKTKENLDFCEYITRFYSSVRLSTSEGIFSVCPKKITLKTNTFEFNMIIKKRIT